MKLYPHQTEALELTKDFNRVAYYYGMGSGKTFIGSEKMKQLGARVNLVICQKSKVNDWVEHFYDNYGIRAFDLTNKKDFEWFIDANKICLIRIGVINYELAWRRTDLLKLKDFTLMLDESSLIQNRKAKQTKFVLKLKAENVILLSGTNCSGKYENLWSQAHLLGWDIKEPLFIKHYVNTYFDKNIGHNVIDKKNPYKNIERLKNKFREHGALFKHTEECVDLPEFVYQEIKVPTSKEYKKFIKDKIITIDNETLVGDTSLTKLLYARQLCSIYSDDKLSAFKDLVESTQDRLIVFYNFNAELDSLIKVCETLERPYSQVNGHVKDLSAYENESNSVTLCQYQSASKGLNLQKCNTIIYYSPTLKCEDWMQSQYRTRRIGQTRTCFYYQLICEKSVEEQIYNSLHQGVDFINELFKD